MSSTALNYVINLLARREYSEFEIRCKMQEKCFTELEIDEVLSYCQQKNWQNDQRFTENYLVFRSQRGYGLNRIKQELQQLKGISSDVIQQALDEAGINWSELALTVLRKKFPQFATISEVKMKQKVWRYMLSHGFKQEDFSHYINNEIE
ncbi:regulatory protein RecX [Pasteurella canis]|uniref:Regulatory protein RecX n=1 Tax=Pasteurella canis TaxID=753 RepID=A0A379EW71_9PAST|nr:recombination regulator RecX [Pasteurella canis]MXN88969.1 recombination regulator RecX [Pasteurella canis]GJJ80893.1 regulatory protein RecX [Pasteurella canis]SUC10552.1 regulatory protein RecX [Pasteurella canis]